MIHSKKLEDTALWQNYQQNFTSDNKRIGWVREIYEAATKYVLNVLQKFPNYTLHDETHILNVLDAIGGLLGNQISQLTVGEMELLILSVCLHDLGMVYTDEEKQRCCQDKDACRKFLREYYPELLGNPAEEWPADVCQWYLRTLHPFRIPEVLQNDEWKDLFDRFPLETVPKRCTNPGIEHAVRDILDRIDEELDNCIKLQKYCRTSWHRDFSFPRAILRNEIESDGYMSGDFCLTMDQAQVLQLLTGENLYDHADVFVRELLQNAVDATLLKDVMDPDFIPEKSRIDLWEWNDKDGNVWFRIDDQGIGMTLGMLQRYFLKVGNSYYNSRELKQDLRDHGHTQKYYGISRFGIGFLSCFLCGDYAEVSTLYFDPAKNRREESSAETYRTIHYGLHLQVTGLSGYYTLKNQAKHHPTDGPMPFPNHFDTNKLCDYERDGYRSKPGTSIVIRLNPGKLGVLNLRKAAEKYLCGTRVPVYYNNKRIGRTYEEMMQTAHELAGERLYELTSEMKEQFDHVFPAVRGQYPKIAGTVIPLDTEADQVLPEFSGLIVKYDVRFDKPPIWKVKNQTYKFCGSVFLHEHPPIIGIRNENTNTTDNTTWNDIQRKYDWEKIAALKAEFDKHTACPQTTELKDDVWQPFAEFMTVHNAWKAYCDYQYCKVLRFSLAECGCPNPISLNYNNQFDRVTFVYHGIITSHNYCRRPAMNNNTIFLLGNRWKPIVNISRSEISALSLEVLTAIWGILNKYQVLIDSEIQWSLYAERGNHSLKDWRKARISQLHEWMLKNQETVFAKTIQMLLNPLIINIVNQFTISRYNECSYNVIYYRYLAAWLQDNFQMTINYEKGQIIMIDIKTGDETADSFDLFPPMMFCKAASDRSRQYICSAEHKWRRGITLDHPFTIWLMENSVQLNQYYERQFQLILLSLCDDNAEKVIQVCNSIRKQLMALPEHHGVDVNSFPQLGLNDFWWV